MTELIEHFANEVALFAQPTTLNLFKNTGRRSIYVENSINIRSTGVGPLSFLPKFLYGKRFRARTGLM